jgi:hypothetical protein
MDSKTSATDSSKDWNTLSDKTLIKPVHWDGMIRWDPLPRHDGNNFIGTCYQFMDEFYCFYDSDYDVCSVVVWAEIPDVIENKRFTHR